MNAQRRQRQQTLTTRRLMHDANSCCCSECEKQKMVSGEGRKKELKGIEISRACEKRTKEGREGADEEKEHLID